MFDNRESPHSREKESKKIRCKAPLVSWDIYMQAYQSLLLLSDDLQTLKEFAVAHKWEIRWNAEEALLRQSKAFMVTDKSFQILFASANTIETNGNTPDELKGNRLKTIEHEDLQAIIHRIPEQPQPYISAFTYPSKEGITYKCCTEIYPVLNTQKQLVHFIAFEARCIELPLHKF